MSASGKKLNGWQRIGVVLSVLWGMGAYVYSEIWFQSGAKDFANRMGQLCSDTPEEYRKIKDCFSLYSENFNFYYNTGFWQQEISLTLIPVLLGWVMVYIAIYITKWIRRGFFNTLGKSGHLES